MDRLLQIPSLHIQIKLSHIAQYYCAAIILLSWLAIALAAVPLFVHMLLIAVVGAFGWRAMRQLQMLPVRAMEYRNGYWFLRVDDVLHTATLGKQYFLAYGMLSLPFHLPSGKTLRVVLWPDSADADSLRRLRVILLAQ